MAVWCGDPLRTVKTKHKMLYLQLVRDVAKIVLAKCLIQLPTDEEPSKHRIHSQCYHFAEVEAFVSGFRRH